MKQILLTTIFLMVILLGLNFCNEAMAQTASLPDIKGHWAQSEIEMLLRMKVLEGRPTSYGQIKFYPENKITRAEFIVMLVNALNIKPKEDTTVFSYKDTHNHWAEPFIEAATDAKITGGVGDGSFLPNEPIKRYEIAVMLVRAKKVVSMKNSVTSFSDVDKEMWFYNSIMLARSNGLISGSTHTKFYPFANSTRAETAAMIARMLYR